MQLHAVKTCKKMVGEAPKKTESFNGIYLLMSWICRFSARWRACRTYPKPWPSRMTWKFWKIASRRCARTGDTWQLYNPGDACRTYLDLYYGLICQLTFPDPASEPNASTTMPDWKFSSCHEWGPLLRALFLPKWQLGCLKIDLKFFPDEICQVGRSSFCPNLKHSHLTSQEPQPGNLRLPKHWGRKAAVKDSAWCQGPEAVGSWIRCLWPLQ